MWANIKVIDQTTGDVVARFVFVTEAEIAAQAMADALCREYLIDSPDNDIHVKPQG